MRITSFELTDVGPLKRISVQDMADVVVFAGPNGVGKTHINTALIAFAQNPGSFANVHMRIEATCDEERLRWGNQALIVHRDDQTHHALQALGQSIGVISLGKKLVLIEGQESQSR
jgi:hypothetical protein